MKKRLFSIVAVLALALSIVGCGSSDAETETSQSNAAEEATEATSSSEKITVRIGDVPGFYSLAVADAKGYFDEELADLNAEAEVISFSGGGPAIKESFTAKELDFACLGDLPVDTAIDNGSDIKIIAYSLNKEKATAVVTNADSGIKSIEDLKGKTIGVNVGQLSQGELLKHLENAGLTENDVEIVNLSNNDVLTAIASGDIDAGSSYIDRVLTANENGSNLVSIADGEGLGFANIVLAARTEFTEQNPEIATAVIKALEKADQFIADEANKDEVIKIVSEASDFSEDVVSVTYPAFECYQTIGEEELTKFQTVLDFALEQGLITKKLTTDDTVDTQFLEAAGLQ